MITKYLEQSIKQKKQKKKELHNKLYNDFVKEFKIYIDRVINNEPIKHNFTYKIPIFLIDNLNYDKLDYTYFLIDNLENENIEFSYWDDENNSGYIIIELDDVIKNIPNNNNKNKIDKLSRYKLKSCIKYINKNTTLNLDPDKDI